MEELNKMQRDRKAKCDRLELLETGGRAFEDGSGLPERIDAGENNAEPIRSFASELEIIA